MDLSLTPELQALLARKMASGRYASPEQAVAEALKATLAVDEQRDAALHALRQMMEDGSEQTTAARDWLRRSGEELRGQG